MFIKVEALASSSSDVHLRSIDPAEVEFSKNDELSETVSIDLVSEEPLVVMTEVGYLPLSNCAPQTLTLPVAAVLPPDVSEPHAG